MKIAEYVSKNAAVKPSADIVERWEKRVVAQGLNLRGRVGAEAYIGQYLKAAKAPKAIGFARIAEIKGFPEMAVRFWEEAFFLETGTRGSLENGSVAVPACVIEAPVLQESFGQSPQLLVLVSREEAMRLLRDPAYGVQEKMNGRRALVRVKNGRVSRGNKKGLIASMPMTAADAMASLGNALTDNEDVNGAMHAFDLLEFAGVDYRGTGFLKRHNKLSEIINGLPPSDSFKLVPLYTELEEKLAFVKELEARGAEGFVLKLLSATYEDGDSHGTQWKFQFRAQSAFIVGVRNGSKESVQILVNRADGSLRDMGNLTVRSSIPPPGTIVEVEYLYCSPGATGKLHQPVFKGLRDDVVAADCRIEKIKVQNSATVGEDE